jgi:hypothetical protein
MPSGRAQGRPPPRELRIVRDPPTNAYERREPWDALSDAERQSFQGFEWMGRTDEQPESPDDASPLHGTTFATYLDARMQKSSVRMAELAVSQAEEELRATKAANRLAEEAEKREIKDASRMRVVLLLRSIVMLIALTSFLLIANLSLARSLAADVTPETAVHYLSRLFERAETTLGLAPSDADTSEHGSGTSGGG